VPTSSRPNRPARRTRLRHAVGGVSLAVVAVGAGGVAATVPEGQGAPGSDAAAAVLQAAQPTDGVADELGATAVTHEVTRRVKTASRSADRAASVPVKRDVLTRASRSGGQVAGREDLGSGDPRQVARAMLSEFGFSAGEFSCLDSLWEKESGWDPQAVNPSSGAHGIPQALPGSKMASAGADWADNPATQIRWGLGYIQDRYGSPCSAWSHSQANNWY
jgi:hypothetical protein